MIALVFIVLNICLTGFSFEKNGWYKNYYGKGYGTEWIFFPDGDDIPHFVNLTMPGFNTKSSFHYLEYRLYTRENKDVFILLDETATPVINNMKQKTYISKEKPIKIITHGWESSADKNSVINIKNAYLETQDVTVIAIDWSKTAGNMFYPHVAYETKSVGKQLATFLNSLQTQYSVTGEQIHLIGHSLGAHIVGIAASESKLNINRVTGLDPARPLFEVPPQSYESKLDRTDAKFVDIIHTCGGVLGVKDPIGHADFYPNSGEAPQPGCNSLQMYLEACSHSRAHFYFAESIWNPTAFNTFQSNSWTDFVEKKFTSSSNVFMGESVNKSVTGKFYLKTNYVKPFGRGLNY